MLYLHFGSIKNAKKKNKYQLEEQLLSKYIIHTVQQNDKNTNFTLKIQSGCLVILFWLAYRSR